jgi:hypothetical protein
VQTVSIDMCSAYRTAVQKHLPHATLVVDHFHLVQLANQAVSAVRRRVTATLRAALLLTLMVLMFVERNPWMLIGVAAILWAIAAIVRAIKGTPDPDQATRQCPRSS